MQQCSNAAASASLMGLCISAAVALSRIGRAAPNLAACRHALPADPPGQVRTHMREVKTPSHYDRVYKDECMFCFATAESPGGLYINLTTHQVGAARLHGLPAGWTPLLAVLSAGYPGACRCCCVLQRMRPASGAAHGTTLLPSCLVPPPRWLPLPSAAPTA